MSPSPAAKSEQPTYITLALLKPPLFLSTFSEESIYIHDAFDYIQLLYSQFKDR